LVVGCLAAEPPRAHTNLSPRDSTDNHVGLAETAKGRADGSSKRCLTKTWYKVTRQGRQNTEPSLHCRGCCSSWIRHLCGSEDLRAPRARILLQMVSSLQPICAGHFFSPDFTPKPRPCGSSHTRCVATTSLRGAQTQVTSRKLRVSTRTSSNHCLASKSMTISGSHHPSHNLSLKRSQDGQSGSFITCSRIVGTTIYFYMFYVCSPMVVQPWNAGSAPSRCVVSIMEHQLTPIMEFLNQVFE